MSLKPVKNKSELKVGRLYLELEVDANVNRVITDVPHLKRIIQKYNGEEPDGRLNFSSITFFEIRNRIEERRFNNYAWYDVTHLYANFEEMRKLNVI